MEFNWYSSELVVLPLRVSLPIIRHKNAGKAGVSVEDNAKHVPGFAFMVVSAGIDSDNGGNMRLCGRAYDFYTKTSIVAHGEQVVDTVQFGVFFCGVVYAGDGGTQFVPEFFIIA